MTTNDFRKLYPRYQGENLERNRELVERVKRIALEKGVMPAQLVLAWVLSRGNDIVPIPGTKRRTYLEQNAAAIDVLLTKDELSELDELGEGVGDRDIELPLMNL